MEINHADNFNDAFFGHRVYNPKTISGAYNGKKQSVQISKQKKLKKI